MESTEGSAAAGTEPVLAYDRESLDAAAEAYLAAVGWADPELDRTIAAADEMFSWAEFHRSGSRQQALVSYFTGGVMASRAVEAVLGWRFGAAGRPRVLDFASGWGRVTRFLARRRPAADLTVSDIDAAAVEFQRRRFGVAGFPSAPRPEQLVCGERFDAVSCLSLFSHLPEETFGGWLARMVDLVAPGGVLMFSVHDAAHLPRGRTMPESGLYFEGVSETQRLDLAAYGSTWVSEAHVGGLLASLGRPDLAWRRYPGGLWHFQDLYVVLPDGGADLAGCELPDEPAGHLDGWVRAPNGDVELSGWCATPRGPAASVEVLLGGRPVGVVEPHLRRDDIVAVLGEPGERSGWRLTLSRRDASRGGEVLLVVAESTDGTRGAIHAATLEATAHLCQYTAALGEAEAERRRQVEERDRKLIALGWEAEVLRRRLAAVEASRFWKLRGAWFALKRRLGLTAAE